MATELVTVTINGTAHQVEKGASLIEVCKEKGSPVPSFCYYSDLALQASCRMCLVRVEKMPKLQTACTLTCNDGMNVTTDSEEIEKARRAMLEFLLANHPLDCPVCDRGGECELQELTFDWGGLDERFHEKKNAFPEKYLSPMVANDQQRCILCKRCTRVCDEWMGEEAIEAGNRGVNTVIGTFGGWLNCSQCGNCIEVCPTGTLLDATYRHQARPWELDQTVSTCTYCSDGCQISVGSRAGEVMRVVARDRYVNGINGEFLCIKGRFAHNFVNDDGRIRTPLVRYKKGGKLIPATWDEALRIAAEGLQKAMVEQGEQSVGVIGSARLTNEANHALLRFARDVAGTKNFSGIDGFSLRPFFENLGGPLATHKDIRHAQTIILIGGEPEEMQPFTGKQIRQAVRNGGAKLVIVNSTPIRLINSATRFVHINSGTEDAAVLALTSGANDDLAARKMGIEAAELSAVRDLINNTSGSIVIMFGGEVSPAAQAVIAQLPHSLRSDNRNVLLHPLALFSNSIGLHDSGLMSGNSTVRQMLEAAGNETKAMYIAGSLFEEANFLATALGQLDFLVVQELFQTETTAYADVVFPAASFAEVDGTYTNNDGFIQRVRTTIDPVHQAKPDWVITSLLAKQMGIELGFQMSASTVFRSIAASVPAYEGLGYPALKDESKPVQVKHAVVAARDLSTELNELTNTMQNLSDDGSKTADTPPVGHKLFVPGTLTGKTGQFALLAGGNPEPENVFISPLYQISLDESLKREPAVAGD
ncbi:MAG: molybdopterin-dependent oxidoreductase [Pyrinomonadaceae bacterium]